MNDGALPVPRSIVIQAYPVCISQAMATMPISGGPASASNGICMSTLHHAAFDSYLIGVDPDLKIHVSRSIFDTDDGPLLASLQGLDGTTLRIETRPDPGFLEWRFDKFKAVQE